MLRKSNCKYCTTQFVYEKGNHQAYATHVRNCLHNPYNIQYKRDSEERRHKREKENIKTHNGICEACELPFSKQYKVSNKYIPRFCSDKCARQHKKKDKATNCINCKQDIRHYSVNRLRQFCCRDCSWQHRRKENIKKFNQGLIRDRPHIRKILTVLRGYTCNCCAISEWNNKPITLQVNHIDGNCTNNMPDNLELICPNCHTQTDTYSGRNKGNGRKARGLPLHY